MLSLLQFYGACLKTESTVLVVEYMPGGDLMEALAQDRRGELRWMRRGHNIALDLARALVYLHKNKVSRPTWRLGAATHAGHSGSACLPELWEDAAGNCLGWGRQQLGLGSLQATCTSCMA